MTSQIATRRPGSLFPDPFAYAGREMNSLIDRLLEFPGDGQAAGGWMPAASVWEDENHLHVELELPGVDRDDLEVTFEEGRLLVSARRPQPEGERRYYHNERGWGEVKRSFALPDSADPDSIEANLERGILHVTLAKRPEVLPRKIEIKSS